MVILIMNVSKICLIGGPKTGKTAFMLRHLTGEFREKYAPTLGCEVHPLNFKTNNGIHCLNIWDTAGQAQYGGLRDGYYIGSDAAIAFYNKDNIDETNELVRNFKQICPNAQIINVWSYSDVIENSKYFTKQGKINRSVICQGNRTTYAISAKSNYNFEKPFQEILRMLTKNPLLQII